MTEWTRIDTTRISGQLTELAKALRRVARLYVQEESRRIEAMAKAVARIQETMDADTDGSEP